MLEDNVLNQLEVLFFDDVERMLLWPFVPRIKANRKPRLLEHADVTSRVAN